MGVCLSGCSTPTTRGECFPVFRDALVYGVNVLDVAAQVDAPQKGYLEAPADVVPGLAVVRPEIGIARRDDPHHVLVVCFQELDHGFRCVAFSAWAAVARCHEYVGVVDLFAARDFHCPGVESVCYGLGAPG